MPHVSEAWKEEWKLVVGIGVVLFWAAFVYTTYLAIEPYFRRRWPRLLVSWSRVLSGRFADPRVGRDLLVGCLAGALMGILVLAPEVLALNLPRQVPWTPYSARQAVPLRDCIAYRVCGVVPPSGQKRQRTARRHRYGNGMACGRIHQDGQRIDGLYCFRNAVAPHDGVRGRHTQDRAWRSRNSLVPECGRSPFRGR